MTLSGTTRSRRSRGHWSGDHSECDRQACAAAMAIRMAEVAEIVRTLPADDPRNVFTEALAYAAQLHEQGFPDEYRLLVAELDCAYFDEDTQAEPTWLELNSARMFARRLSELKDLMTSR